MVCPDGTTRGRRQPHRVEDLGLTPEARGGAAEALRTPAPCVRSTLPPCPATFLSLAQASTSGLATRPVVDAEAWRGICAHMTPRPPVGAERPGASFGERGQRPAHVWSWCGQRRRVQHLQPPKQSSHAHSRALCARRARPWPPEQPSPSPRPARRAPGIAGAAHRALRPPAHAAQPPRRRSEAPHQPPDRRCEEAEWPGRQLGGSAPAYHIHGGAPAPTSRGLAASSQSARPRAALGGHAGVGGSGARRSAGWPRGRPLPARLGVLRGLWVCVP